jgi:hypothetical protein
VHEKAKRHHYRDYASTLLKKAPKGGKPKDFVNKKNNFKRKQKIYFYFLEEIKRLNIPIRP